MKQSPELQRENARDLVCAWALVTEALLGTCDPDLVEHMFQTARERAEGWTDEQSQSQLEAVLHGDLTAAVFNAAFVESYRRSAIVKSE